MFKSLVYRCDYVRSVSHYHTEMDDEVKESKRKGSSKARDELGTSHCFVVGAHIMAWRCGTDVNLTCKVQRRYNADTSGPGKS